jgi:hypothetical protein
LPPLFYCATQRAAHDAYVDFLHGFALGVRGELTPALRRRLRAELAIVIAGIATSAAASISPVQRG